MIYKWSHNQFDNVHLSFLYNGDRDNDNMGSDLVTTIQISLTEYSSNSISSYR